MRRVLVGSPVHQRPEILAAFLGSLRQLESGSGDDRIQLDFIFIDDNTDERSSLVLGRFAQTTERVRVFAAPESEQAYVCDEVTHRWTEQLCWKVGAFKDIIIEHAVDAGYDALFLADSDLVVHPKTIAHLASLGLDIVSEVFWTKWQPNSPELPQVYFWDQYDMVPRRRDEVLTPEQQNQRFAQFLAAMRTPGVYDVGFLGACTLLSRNALVTGARFKEIPNLSLWGEDRHFCVRASALGLRLHADTHYAPLHLYRDSEIERIPAFVEANGMQPVDEWLLASA